MDKKNQEVEIRNSIEINEDSANKKFDDINNIKALKRNSNKIFYF